MLFYFYDIDREISEGQYFFIDTPLLNSVWTKYIALSTWQAKLHLIACIPNSLVYIIQAWDLTSIDIQRTPIFTHTGNKLITSPVLINKCFS